MRNKIRGTAQGFDRINRGMGLFDPKEPVAFVDGPMEQAEGEELSIVQMGVEIIDHTQL
jgi:hypothetical protein